MATFTKNPKIKAILKYLKKQKWKGLAVTLLVIAVLILLQNAAHWQIINPGTYLLFAIIYAAFAEGLISGFVSAFLASTYLSVFYSVPGRVLHYSGGNGTRFISSLFVDFAVAGFIGYLQVRNQKMLQRQAERQREELTSERFGAFADALPHLLWTADSLGVVDFRNSNWYEYTGLSRSQSAGTKTLEIIHPGDRDAVLQSWQQAQISKEGYEVECRLRGGDGQYAWFLMRVVPLKNESGEIVKWLASATDVSLRKQAQEELEKSKDQLEVILNGVGDAITVQDGSGQLLYANAKAAEFLGFSDPADLLKVSTAEILDKFEMFSEQGQPLPAESLPGRLALLGQHPPELLMRSVIKASGQERWSMVSAAPVFDQNGTVQMAVNIFRDVSQRQQAESQIYDQVYRDALTNLPNRKFFEENLNLVFEQAKRTRSKFAVMFLDLDRLKPINDSLGHQIGDMVLREAASRIASALRKQDVVARWGGDEFVVLLPDIRGVSQVTHLAEKILAAISPLMRLNKHNLYLTGSIGIAFYPTDGVDTQTLQKNADSALYRAKEAGKNRYELYDLAQNVRGTEKLTLENDLRQALASDELRLFFQPVLDLQSNQIVSAESLLRWQHPRLGLLSPHKFLSIAEEVGLIVPMGAWVFKTACETVGRLKKAGLTLRLSVNISARQFGDNNFLPEVFKILEQTKTNPKFLEMEITESVAMENVDQTRNKLHELQSLGLTITVDDFGTGYSSLNYLRQFPIDNLKIDKSFVRHVITNQQDTSIIKAIVSMAHSLNLKTVAEGVDSEMQIRLLQSVGCDMAQGYYTSRPVEFDDFVSFVKKWQK